MSGKTELSFSCCWLSEFNHGTRAAFHSFGELEQGGEENPAFTAGAGKAGDQKYPRAKQQTLVYLAWVLFVCL